MKRALCILTLVTLWAMEAHAQDFVITKGGDTIRCELYLPPLPGDKLFYYGRGEGENPMRFIPYEEVKFIHEGTTDRYYYIDTNDKWVEIVEKRFRPMPQLRNRLKVAAGVELAYGMGAAPVFQVDYIRYQWKNFGIGVVADYVYHEYYEQRDFSRRYTSDSFFVGPLVSGRFYGYNSNSFFYINLALGYYGFYGDPRPKSRVDVINNLGFLATAGWEILLSRSTHWAVDLELHLYTDGLGFTAGVKFGR